MDKVYIKALVQQILDKEFSDPARRKINEYSDRINFCAPCCGDSSKNRYAKRGNIWWNKLIYVCFNCGKKTNLDKILKDFNLRIDPDKKLEIINHLDSVISYKDAEDDFLDTEFDKLISLDDVERIFNSGDHVITDFKPVVKGGTIFQYLLGRGIDSEKQTNIWEAKYWYNSDRWEPIICFLNRKGKKVLGIQIRNLKDGKRRLFKIYNFETLYKWIHDVEEVIDIDLNQLVIYNKLSYYFNILNVDFNSRVTIFEGYLDSLFYPNSIGVVGVNTDMRFLESNSLDIQYFFDNDTAGFDKSEQKLKEGFSVFLWKKLFQHIVDTKKSEDPYSLMWRINKIKDLNKLAELVPKPYSKLKLSEFFSSDVLDIRWIPKKERKWKKQTQKK